MGLGDIREEALLEISKRHLLTNLFGFGFGLDIDVTESEDKEDINVVATVHKKDGQCVGRTKISLERAWLDIEDRYRLISCIAFSVERGLHGMIQMMDERERELQIAIAVAFCEAD